LADQIKLDLHLGAATERFTEVTHPNKWSLLKHHLVQLGHSYSEAHLQAELGIN
jgi:hypothetical protein